MKLIMEKVLSSCTLPKTIIMVNFTSLKYSKNALTTMTIETKLPHNLVVQSKVTMKWWIQDTMVVVFHCYVRKKTCLVGQIMLDLANQQPKYCMQMWAYSDKICLLGLLND